MQTYQYLGEAEQIVPFTLDGPRVLEQGDTINVADDDESFKDHPLFAKVTSPAPAAAEADPTPAPEPVPDPTPAPAPVPDPEPATEPAPAAEPDPAPTEPTA